MSTVLRTERAVVNHWPTTRAVLGANLLATAAAAAATEMLTAVVRAGGVHLAVGDPGGDAGSVVTLKVGACALSVAFAMVLGCMLALVVSRVAKRPVGTYRIAAGVLLALSLIAPLTAAATSAATKATLVAAHLLAAAVVLPIVTRSLARADRPAA